MISCFRMGVASRVAFGIIEQHLGLLLIGCDQKHRAHFTSRKLVPVVAETSKVDGEGCHCSGFAATSADAAPEFIDPLQVGGRSGP